MNDIVCNLENNFPAELAYWADSVIETQCPYVCDNSKHTPPGVLENFGQRVYF